MCYQRVYAYDLQRHSCRLDIPKWPEILPRLSIFDLETFPAGGENAEHKCALIVALFEEQIHGHFCKIAFANPFYETTDSQACAVPGYLYFDYVPSQLPNLIVAPVGKRINKRPKDASNIHFKLGTPSMLVESSEALRRQYQGYKANLRKYHHLSRELLHDPTIHFLLYFCQECFYYTNCVSQYGGR